MCSNDGFACFFPFLKFSTICRFVSEYVKDLSQWNWKLLGALVFSDIWSRKEGQFTDVSSFNG